MRIARLPPTSLATPAWPPLLASQGTGTRSSPHAHHAMHFVVAAEGALEVRAGKARMSVPGVVTAADVPHAIDASDREVLLVFVDPESDVGGALAAALDGPVCALDAAARSALYTRDALALMQGEGDAWIRRAVGHLGIATPAPWPPLHPRVRRVQGRGHRGESAAPVPFTGPGDFVSRFLVEQLVSFPRFVLTGGWLRAWRRADRAAAI